MGLALAFGAVLLFIPARTAGEVATNQAAAVPERRVPIPPTGTNEKSEAVIAALLAFVNSPNHASRCRHLIGRSKMREQLEAYYGKQGHSFPKRIINPTVTAFEVGYREIIIILFIDQDGKRISAPFEWDIDGYRLHWEAMTGSGDIPWQDFFDRRPEGDFNMRVNLFVPKIDHELPNDNNRIIALISHPDLQQARTVAIPVGSEVHNQLLDHPSETDIPAHIGIQWLDGEGSLLPVLTKWHHRDWIAP
jgi:hypothetical protein